LNTG